MREYGEEKWREKVARVNGERRLVREMSEADFRGYPDESARLHDRKIIIWVVFS